MADEVVETNVAEVHENEEGIPEQVNDYEITELLGEGAYAKVFKCVKEENGMKTPYAMKIFNKSLLKRKREFKKVNGKMVMSNAFQKVQKEIAIMKKLCHLNLTRLYEVIDSPQDDKLFLVLEFVPNGQIMDWEPEEGKYVNSRTDGIVDEVTARKCTADIILGIEYLHANHICHRDIKPENILVGVDDVFKLADFGVAHMFEDEGTKELKSIEGTYHFFAPECTSGESYDPYRSDIWSLGVTVYAMVFGVVPFGGSCDGGVPAILEAIKTQELSFPADVSPDCQDILKRMLDKNPATRITVGELKDHPWTQTQQRMRGKSYPPITAVEVSMEEINLAFTPINNIILMTKLKIKMRGKLSKARMKLKGVREAVRSPKRGHSDVNLSSTEEEEIESLDKKNKQCLIS